jgi:hypothetical protein
MGISYLKISKPSFSVFFFLFVEMGFQGKILLRVVGLGLNCLALFRFLSKKSKDILIYNLFLGESKLMGVAEYVFLSLENCALFNFKGDRTALLACFNGDSADQRNSVLEGELRILKGIYLLVGEDTRASCLKIVGLSCFAVLC